MTTPSTHPPRPGADGPILSRVAWRIAMAAADRVKVGRLHVVLPDGSRRTFGEATAEPAAEIHIHDRRALTKLLVDGETGGGEAYMDGLWSSPDLAGLLRWAALNRESLALSAGWFRAPAQLRRTLAHRLRRNTKGQSRKNISAHYDLGNEFYRTFLDETMTYSSAVFASPEQSLADAQRNKYRLHGRRSGPGRGPARPRDRDRLGRIRPVRGRRARLPRDVRHDLPGAVRAGARAGRRGGPGRTSSTSSSRTTATSPARTTRSSRSRCSRRSGPSTTRRSSRSATPSLVPGGKLSIQSITFPDAAYERQLRGANWIQTYIFPGGLCPSLAVIERATRDTGLLITQVADIADSYVRTLREWRTRFMAQAGVVRSMGFDDRFIRMWEYYLALSEAGFATGVSQDLQLVLEKRRGLAPG